MLGPFATASRLTPIHQVSLAVLSRAACASMPTTSTTTTRNRGDRYGPMEWAQRMLKNNISLYCDMTQLWSRFLRDYNQLYFYRSYRRGRSRIIACRAKN